LNRPNWDYGDAEGREHLQVYCQTLMAGLQAAACHPTNLAKVKAIMQGENESPATFLECLYGAYRLYTPLDPLAEENQSAMIMSFINQAAPDSRKKLYKQEGLGEITIILRPCRSAWNTPLLPVKKPGGKDYRPVQDLREVNKRVEDIHPTVPNPYTLLSHLPPSHV
jgi:hypothetical protein